MNQSLLDRLRRHAAYPYAVAVLTGLVGLILGLQWRLLTRDYGYGSPGTDDFIEYWTAGQLLREGYSPYDFPRLYSVQLELDSPHGFPIIMWNPPWLLVWLYPLLLLPFLSAAVVWLLCNAGLFLLSTWLVWRTVCSGPEGKSFAIAVLAGLLFVPLLMTLRMGQVSSVVLLGVAGFLYFAVRGREFPAGFFLALTTIKPHVVYLLGIGALWWVVTGRRWKAVAGAVALMAPTIVTLSLVWPDWWAGYREALERAPLYWATATLGGILRKLIFTDLPQAQFFPPLVGTIAFATFLAAKRPSLEWRTALGPILLISVPTAAYGWAFDQALLLVPYLTVVSWLVLQDGVERKDRWIITLSLALIAAGMLALNLLQVPDVYFFWPPLAWGLVYIYARLGLPAKAVSGSASE